VSACRRPSAAWDSPAEPRHLKPAPGKQPSAAVGAWPAASVLGSRRSTRTSEPLWCSHAEKQLRSSVVSWMAAMVRAILEAHWSVRSRVASQQVRSIGRHLVASWPCAPGPPPSKCSSPSKNPSMRNRSALARVRFAASTSSEHRSKWPANTASAPWAACWWSFWAEEVDGGVQHARGGLRPEARGGQRFAGEAHRGAAAPRQRP